MAGVKLALLNEVWEPMADVVIEAYDTGTGDIDSTATTASNGIATFSTITFPVTDILFKPRNTRSAGPKGDKPPTAGQEALEKAQKNTYGSKPEDETQAENPEGGDGTQPMGIMHLQLIGPA